MSIKFGKILNYKDVEEAKKLIGKRVAFCDILEKIEKSPDECEIKPLVNVNSQTMPFSYDWYNYQFIREVIEEGPQYRPFNSVDELTEHWNMQYAIQSGERRAGVTMPLIWIKSKSTGNKLLLTAFFALEVGNGEDVYSMNQLLEKFTFLDGSPLGVEVTE